MRVKWRDFDPALFSFARDPVLILDEFWTDGERHGFQHAMGQGTWTMLRDMPGVQADFPHSGNWSKAELGMQERKHLLDRLQLACIANYIESLPGISGRHVSFNYYSYGAGDCLLTHDDRVQRGGSDAVRRLALVTYLHDEWHPDWGGELIVYEAKPPVKGGGTPKVAITHCVSPDPGSLVLFTVPRLHRVCRVDPTCGEHRRLSIAGWFLTSQAPSQEGQGERSSAASGLTARRVSSDR